MRNYTPLHLHTDFSNCVTNIDSVSKYSDYIQAAKERGMSAIAFTEHGNVFGWRRKKDAVEAAGMKYIHATECYITETLDNKVRDNYHCILIARDKDGLHELNRLISRSFLKDDNHFYYVPRISLDELFATSDHIILTTACIGGVLGEKSDSIQDKIIDFWAGNKDRCFFEIAHHPDPRQIEHNIKLMRLSNRTGVKLTFGSDAHAVDADCAEGRIVLQKSKKISFPDENAWDLQFRTCDEVLNAFEKQELLGGVPSAVYSNAIENTNMIADMIEPINIDRSAKYPHVFDNPYDKLLSAALDKAKKHRYLNERYSQDEINRIILEEMDVYKRCGAVDYMLLRNHLQDWQDANGIVAGPGRGSVSGSMLAYILGVTQMDSKRFDLNLFRFLNPDRVSLADIDTDYSSEDRDRVKEYLLRDHMNIPALRSAEIVTFNTIDKKGAIRDVARAMDIPLQEVDLISKSVENENEFRKWQKTYPELFRFADIVSGTIVSMGTHPSGVLICDRDIESEICTCSISSTPYPVSSLDMKELDGDMWVKWDVLGLANVGLINQTCEMAGIEYKNPDNTPLDDPEVWKSIRDDNTTIFQWESVQAGRFLKRLLSDETINRVKAHNTKFSMLKWFSFGNGLLRPACASFRDEAADGNFKSTGLKQLDDFLSPEMGHISMQETIMKFLVKFCGYSDAESDSVRRAIAKKKGTDSLIPEIRRRFLKYTPEHYDASKEDCERIIDPFIKTIEDASSYGFSWNHSDAYSCIGYICGWLRYYYPCEYVASALNVFSDDQDKVSAIMEYARTKKIKVTSPKFGSSKWYCSYDKKSGSVSKGLSSVKYINNAAADALYDLYHALNKNVPFSEVLRRIYQSGAVNMRQVSTLIDIGFFSECGDPNVLRSIHTMYDEQLGRGSRSTINVSSMPPDEKSKIDPYIESRGKNGNALKNARILDVCGLAAALEEVIRSKETVRTTAKELARKQVELMGYVDMTTGKDEDKATAIVLDTRALCSKSTGKPWAFVLRLQSFGNGVIADVTVRKSLYDKKPVSQYDVVRLLACGKERGYNCLYDYKIM